MLNRGTLAVFTILALGFVLSACQSSGLKQSFSASLPVQGEIVFSD